MESRRQITENRNEDGGQRANGRRRKVENGKQRTEDGERKVDII